MLFFCLLEVCAIMPRVKSPKANEQYEGLFYIQKK